MTNTSAPRTTVQPRGIGHTADVLIDGRRIGEIHRVTSGTWTASRVNTCGALVGLPHVPGQTQTDATAAIVAAVVA